MLLFLRLLRHFGRLGCRIRFFQTMSHNSPASKKDIRSLKNGSWILDILPIHGRIKHPQTQGKIERFHRTLKSELLKRHSIADIEDAERQFQCWREKYNHMRPHEALGMRCPREVYYPSGRKYPEKISAYEYEGQYHVIKVNSWGYVRFDKWQIYLSETMIGQNIEFR